MRRDIDLGFIALTDAAPLIAAHELGYFAEEGLAVTLHREVSWATIRDKVGARVYQGAHMLAPMLLAQNAAEGASAFVAPMSLNAHGAAIGVSHDLATAMAAMNQDAPLSARALADVVEGRRVLGQPALTFAVVFPTSMHNYMLRYWAASAGIDPDRDIRIVIAPPTSIAVRLKSREIDGFCVGAPWPAFCQQDSGARIVLDAGEFWPGGPDKVLGLSGAWAEREPDAALALTRAVLRASLWADEPRNVQELARMLARPAYVSAPAEIIARRLGKMETANIRFAQCAAAFPWKSQAAWILSQMLRWGQIEEAIDLAPALDGYRPDLYRAAASALDVSAPIADLKLEGAHADDWMLDGTIAPIRMTGDRFFDGGPFDPAQIRQSAAASAITRAKG